MHLSNHNVGKSPHPKNLLRKKQKTLDILKPNIDALFHKNETRQLIEKHTGGKYLLFCTSLEV